MHEYHRVWLEHHPGRSEQWLQDRLNDGFGIHHLDGDHDNNEPSNLILLEWIDHKMLHNGGKRPLVPVAPWSKCIERIGIPQMSDNALSLGEAVYAQRMTGRKWIDIASSYHRTVPNVIDAAREYAFYNAMIWPMPILPAKRTKRPKQPRKKKSKPAALIPKIGPCC